MMSKKMQEKFKDEMEGADNKKEADIMSENVDAKGGIISVFRETAEMDDSEDW